MRQLRQKLEENPSRPRYLVTEPWVGYRFNSIPPSEMYSGEARELRRNLQSSM
jgi:hypothetical protein